MNQTNRASTRARLQGALWGLTSAVLFGASAPIAKLLLPSCGPLLLAGLLYAGAGVGLAAMRLIERAFHAPAGRESPLRRADVPYIAGSIATGGIIGPILLLLGLGRLSAVAGSLLLNLEAPFTILAAVLLFREHLGARAALASSLLIAGAILLGGISGRVEGDPLGALCVAGAALAWALDNNLTQRVSLRDPVSVARIKTMAAGACTLAIALLVDRARPPAPVIAASMLLGFASYGVSIVCYVRALRVVGAARQAAFFATAPFVGAIVAVPVLGERITIVDAIAGAVMAAGVVLLVGERHSHVHRHEAIVHEHAHVTDEHHQHAHAPDDPPEPHSHVHTHPALTHDHPHVSDVHHRHGHGS